MSKSIDLASGCDSCRGL